MTIGEGMDLAGLKTYLEGLGSPMTLSGGDTHLGPQLDALIASMPGGAITLEPGADGIVLDGDTLTVSGTSTDTWPVQGMDEATIHLSSAVIVVKSTPDSATATVHGKLPIKPVDVSVVVTPIEESASWAVALDAPSSGVTPTELVALATGATLPFPIPPGLVLFDESVSIDPSLFTIRFTPNTTAHAYYGFTISAATGAWPLIDGVIDFNGIDLVANITTGGWSLTIVGHVTIASVKVDVGVQMSNADVWSAYVAPTDAPTFPGITDLANWIASGGTLADQTTQGFANLGLDPSLFNLALSKVTLSFNRVTAKVTALEIDSRLTIVGLGLDLVLTMPELTLVGSLADGKPVKVVDMLSSADLSTSEVPTDLTIEKANFSAQPSAGHYDADVDVTGIWTSGPVQLEEVKSTVTYDKPPGTASDDGPFTGQFEAVIAIGETAEIDLIAKYAGSTEGWTFSGGTPPGSSIAIGDVISDLADTWGISDVPAPVKSLELTKLNVSYQTGTKKFNFTCEGDFTVETTPVKVTFSIDVEPISGNVTTGDDAAGVAVGTSGYQATFGGKVEFSDLQFDIVFDTESTGTDIFVADFVDTGDPTSLHDLVATVSTNVAAAIPAGITVQLNEVKFVFLKQTSKLWLFGLRLGTQINLNELPIVGSKLPADETLAIENLQVMYTSATFTVDQVGVVNKVIPDGVSKLPDAGTGAGIAFEADVKLGSTSEHLQFGVTPPKSGEQSAVSPADSDAAAPGDAMPTTTGSGDASSTDPIKWINVQKQFGIFSFKRVGVGYVDNVLEFALDASVALGPLAFSMRQLTVGSPLTKFEPEFSLAGLSLAFERPPIEIVGSFLKVQETVNGSEVTSYYGELIVGVSQFSLKAVGGWTPDTGSFFIYLSINVPLGGPPFLFVTGIAGGFGINTMLNLPTVDEVGSYILLPALAPPEEATPAETVDKVLASLQHTITPEVGQYWVAAGIAFTSFEMIQAQAVVSVAFGVELQIGVVGVCAMTFPTGDPYPVAYIEIDIVASFTPSTGLLAVDGKLSPASFLFGGFVKLSGGFAFYAWFGGEHRGDFVASIGGYHPAFEKPAWYPAVPRLELSFALGGLKVTGQSYFALTANAFMAGIRMSAVFSLGPIKAWFDAGVDFLIAWAPFHYEADAYISVGCSVDLGLFTISVHIGADLEIWGPAFGGKARVDLTIVTFTIGFGADRALPPPVGWATFRTNFLPPDTTAAASPAPMGLAAMPAAALAATTADPATTNIVSASIEAGKLADGSHGVDWIIDPDTFRILTASTIPSNNAEWSITAEATSSLPNVVDDYHREADDSDPDDDSVDDASLAVTAGPPPGMYLRLATGTTTASETEVWAPALDIGPMDESDVQSYQTVTLLKANEDGNFVDYITGVSVEPVLAPSNTAMWATRPDDPSPNDQRLIPATLTGFRIRAVPRKPAQVSDIPLLELIFGEGHSTGFDHPTPAIDTRYTVASSVTGDVQTIEVGGDHTAKLQNVDFVLNALNDPWVVGQRASVLDELIANGFGTTAPDDIDVHDMATTTTLTDWPEIALLGDRS